MTTHTYENLFPFSRIRNEQKQAIEFALESFKSGKKFVCMELPTGVGKSAIGVTVARALETDAYLLTTQKVLQDQYVEDFGPKKLKLLCSIKSASNYDCCGVWGQTCGESRRVMASLKKNGSIPLDYEACKTSCPYTEDKTAFVNSPLGVTNFAYFLAETMYAHQLKPRGLLVLDECHNAEAALSSFIEVVFSIRFAKSQLNCNGPKTATMENVVKWIKGSYRTALMRRITDVEAEIDAHTTKDEIGAQLAKRLELLDKHLCKVNRFIKIYSAENWVMNAIPPEGSNSRADWKYEFKPIDVAPYAHEMLYHYGDHVLLMSATIIDHEVFCKTIGIDVKDVAFIRLPSPFPAENRPVLFQPVGSMSRKNIDKSLPELVKTIRMLLENHAEDKGVIHTGNYRIAQYLIDNVGSGRLLIHDAKTREAVLQQHIESDEPTVLVSPSMTEGVDLRDDASRWQVIAKMPFPYLGDEMTQKRMARNPRWYDFVTARIIIQALGRSVRNEKDHAISYILDEDWRNFYRRGGKTLFTDDFRNSYHGE